MKNSKIRYILLLLLIMLGIAFVTYNHFDSYHLSNGPMPGEWLILDFIIISPVIGLLLGVISYASTRQVWAYIAKIHAGCFLSALIIISIISASEGHSSPASGMGEAISQILYTICFAEIFCIIAGDFRKKKKNIPPPKFRMLLIFTPLIIIGGWSCGVIVWSYFYKDSVIEAAEKEAGDVPYCIFAVTKLASSKRDLMPFIMYDRGDNCCFRWYFHGLLVIGQHNPRFMNWSYTKKEFDLLSNTTIERMGLEDKVKQCSFKQHFAKELP